MATSIVDAINRDIAKRNAAKKKSSGGGSSSNRSNYGSINGQKVKAIQTKRDGSKIYYGYNNNILRETNSQGKVIARVTVNTGISGSGTSGSKTVNKSPSQIMQQKIKDNITRINQQKARTQAYNEGRTAKQQMAAIANQRFIAKVNKSLNETSNTSSEQRRSQLMSNLTLSGQTAKTVTQGIVYKQTLESIRNSPFSFDVIKALTAAVDVSKIDPNKYRYGTIIIAGQEISPSSLKEKNFYTYLNKVEARNNKVNDLALEIQNRAIAGQEKSGVTKFLSNRNVLKRFVDGLTKLGVGTLIMPLAISQALDNAWIRTRGKLSINTINARLKRSLRFVPQVIALKIPKRLTDKIADKITGVIPEKLTSPEVVAKEIKSTRPQKIKTTIKEVGQSFNPAKPENWANIITIIGGLALSGLSIRTNLSKVKGSYVPSVRGIRTIEAGVDDILRASPEIKKGIRSQIKNSLSGKEKRFFTRKLNTALRLEKTANSLKKTLVKYLKYESEGKIIPVTDMNPLIKTAEHLNSMGEFKYLYHVGTKSIKSAFKKGKTPIIASDAESAVVSRVRKVSFTPKRQLSTPRNIDKALISFVRKSGGVVGGAKAQNVFVKRLFTRKTIDYDVFYKNPKLQARKALAYLKRKFPNDTVDLEVLKIPNTKLTVYRIKFNGKDLADFDLWPKDLKKVVKVGKDLVADPEFLAKRKLSTQADITKRGRVVKDAGDLKRLLGRYASDKDFISFLNKPKNVFRVLAQPEGMGKSRIKFNEGQLFFDTEASIGYAVKSLVKLRFKGLPYLQRFANTVAGRKILLPKLLRSKMFKRGAKGVIIRLPVDLNDFVKLPKRLLSRIRSAAKGRLSKAQSELLRKDLVKYIEKPQNMQKISIGSRTGSLTKGEREWVLSTFSELYKKTGRQKFTYDPTTKLFSEIIDVTLKETLPSSKAGRILTRMKNQLKAFNFNELKRRFTKGDLTKLKRYQRLLRLKTQLSDPQYRDLLYYLDSMLSDKKGTRTFTKRFNLKLARSGRKKTNSIKVRKVGRTVKRLTPALARRTVKKITRLKSRVVSRPKSRVVSRVTPRTVARTATRTRVTPRTKPRLRPRITPRIVPRTLRLPPRMPARVRTIIFKKRKKVSLKDKKELLEYVKASKATYRPSLSALIYGITSYKIPKSVNPFQIRPLLIELRKKKIIK